jgi:ribosomal protein S18 acetylase RimI-like enzyme
MGFVLRLATDGDQKELGRMAGALVRMHHALDAARFFLVEPIEEGYGRWLVRTSKSDASILLVAETEGPEPRVVGYAWATLEERDWMMLLDACAALQDIWVDEDARRHGVARALLEGIAERARAKGAPRIVLSTAAKNEAAQRFFEAMGFRRTMIEMTREL